MLGRRVVATFELPPLPAILVDRTGLLTNLRQSLSVGRVAILFGPSGMGKTLLARSYAGKAKSVIWARLRDRQPTEGADILASAVEAAISGRSELLVVDDLGRLGDSAAVADYLETLHTRPFATLITSHARLPVRVSDVLGKNLDEVAIPPFSPSEIRDLLASAGAPPALADPKLLQFFASITRGHPSLLRALVRSIEGNRWQIDHEVLGSLFNGGYATRTKDDAVRFFRETIADTATRTLLYRMDCALGSITRQEVDAVASVAPTIIDPYERLDDLLGIWLLEEGRERWSLSPLLANRAREKLTGAELRASNLALADCILSGSSIRIDQGQRAILYLLNAEEYDRAGVLFASAASYLLSSDSVESEGSLFIEMWRTTPLPKGMRPAIRALVRAFQVQLMDRSGKDPEAAITEIDELVSRALEDIDPREAPPYLLATMTAGVLRTANPPARLLRHTSAAFRLLDAFRNGYPAEVKTEAVEAVHASLWLTAVTLRTPTDVVAWIRILRELSDDVVRHALSSTHAKSAIFMLPKFIVLDEGRLPAPNWRHVSQALSAIEDYADHRALSLLGASARSARIMMLGEFVSDIAAVRDTASKALDKCSGDDDAVWVVRESLGMQLALAHQHDAVSELERVVAHNPHFAHTYQLRALVRLSALTRQADPAASLAQATRALEYVLSSDLPRSESVLAYAELAIATEEISGSRSAYPIWSEGARTLLAEDAVQNTDKEAFLLFGHCLGYYVSMAVNGSAPDKTPDGSAYAKPAAGMFLGDRRDLCARYNAGRRAFIAAQVLMYADALSDEGAVTEWGRRVTDLAEAGDNETRATLASIVLPFQLKQNAISVAFDGAMALGELAAKRPKPPSATPPVSDALIADWVARETFVLPAFLRVATLRLENAPAAEMAAREFISACRSRASGDPAWELAATIATASLLDNAPRSRLRELVNSAMTYNERGLQAVARVATTLASDSTVEQAIADHLPIAVRVADGVKQFSPGFFRQLVFPFFQAFWSKAFGTSRFRFSAPRLFEAELQASIGTGGERGARRLMRAVLSAMGARTPDFARSWLAGK